MYLIDKDVSFRDLNDHAIIVNIRTGFYYSLNGSATAVFHGIRRGLRNDEIARGLTEKYAVDEESARSDVRECVDTFIKEKIVIETEA
ncbi:MAG: PqqD family protein [bacterium]